VSGLGTWDVTWEKCPHCPAPLIPDFEHQCITEEKVREFATRYQAERPDMLMDLMVNGFTTRGRISLWVD
jgi:hypothetical protein